MHVCLTLLLLGWTAKAQTSCAAQHPSGAFICYPNPSENSADSSIPTVFHLSAQGSAADGSKIAGYKVFLDNRLVYENKLAVPVARLPIETNLKSPFDSGTHDLRVVFVGAGSAEVKGLQFYPSRTASFCEPFSRTDPRTCNPSTARGPVHWSIETASGAPTADAFRDFSAFAKLYGENLKSVEADVADAMAVDANGNLIVASHAFADVDLRKYSPNGSLVYASLIRSCGDGFLSVAGLAVDQAGRAWIAGNTTACLTASAGAALAHVSDVSRMRGFVMLVDTSKPATLAPLYVTYFSDTESQIAAIRVDGDGNAYVTGTTTSPEFPHDSSLSIGEGGAPTGSEKRGFVAVINPAGSALRWSTLMPNAQLTSLALDGEGNVYVTGRVRQSQKKPCDVKGRLPAQCDDALVAALSDDGRRLSYAATFGGQADEEGRAISAKGGWVYLAGETESADFPKSSALASSGRHAGLESFAVALQPCKSGAQYSRLLSQIDSDTAPAIALTPALDAFANAFTPDAARELVTGGQKPIASVQIAPACQAPNP